MARVPGYPTSASLGQKTMTRTIQCPQLRRRAERAGVGGGSEAEVPPLRRPNSRPRRLGPGDSADRRAEPGLVDVPDPRGPAAAGASSCRRGREQRVVELPTSPQSERRLRPARPPRRRSARPSTCRCSARTSPRRSRPPTARPSAPPAAADVLALFQDEPKTAGSPRGPRPGPRPGAARAAAASSAVGMSLCNTCGLDLDTGQRVAPLDVFDDEMPEAVPAADRPRWACSSSARSAPWSTCSSSVASLVAWAKGQEGVQFLLVVWLFGIYASVQFLRRKSIRPLFLALSLAVGIGVVYLIALPIYDANVPTRRRPDHRRRPPASRSTPTPRRSRPITEQLDMNKITWGIFSLLAYAGLAVYLNSPAMRREFKRVTTASGPSPESDVRSDRVRGADRRVQAVPASTQAVAASSGLRQIGRSGKRTRAASRAVPVEDSTPSSSTARSMSVWPIRSRTRAGGERVRCLRLSLSGSNRDLVPSMWSSHRRSPTVRPEFDRLGDPGGGRPGRPARAGRRSGTARGWGCGTSRSSPPTPPGR